MTAKQSHAGGRFPAFLKAWRLRRRISQLDLSLEAGLSQRHISFLETGRSRPSRFAIAQLGDALQMPAAEVDAMLQAAGYAARSVQNSWGQETRHAIDAAIDHILKGHAPYPAFVVDRLWTLQKGNDPALRFFAALGAGDEVNILRALLKPGPVRACVKNWEETVKALMRLLELEAARRPHDLEAADFLKDLMALPGVEDACGQPASEAPAPVLAIELQADGQILNLISLIATVGMSADAVLDDMRIETFLPADEPTRAWFYSLSGVALAG